MTTCVYVDNTNVIELRGLRNMVDNVYVNDADVTVTVKDDVGVNIGGQSWPSVMDYVTSSNGIYRGIIEDGADMTAGSTYYAFIEADDGAGQVAHWEFAFVPQVRRAT